MVFNPPEAGQLSWAPDLIDTLNNLNERIITARQLGLSRWDDFDRADSTIASSTTLPSGQTWLTYTDQALGADHVIQDGTLRLLTSGAGYAWTTGLTDPFEASVEFEFTAGSTHGSTVGLILSNKTGSTPFGANGIAANSVHAGFGSNSWSVGIVNGVSLSLMASGSYTALPPGVRYRASLSRVGPDRILVNHPGGSTLIRDRRIPQWWGPAVLIENFQPAGTFATDMLPVITGYGVGLPAPRGMALDLPTGLAGIPGGVPTGAAGTVAFASGTTRYTPIECTDPITLASAVAEVTVVAGAGSKARVAILEANEAWQPTRLLADLGEQPIDALGVITWPSTLALRRGRYLLGFRAAASATFRYIPYSVPGAGGMRAVLSAAPFAQSLQVTEAYGAFADPPTVWNVVGSSAAVGWITPAYLTWAGL